LSQKGLGERRRGGVLGRMGGFALGPGGYCVCPKCGAALTRKIGSSGGIFGLGILRF